MKKSRTIRAPYVRRMNRMIELSKAVGELIGNIKGWQMQNQEMADDITYRVLMVEKALERLV